MKQNTFWRDASKAGATIGVVGIITSLLAMLVPSIAFVANLINFVATIYLLFYFTRKRAALYANEGFSYSMSIGFMAGSAIFAGIIMGAYSIVANNFLFTEQVEETLQTLTTTYTSMGTIDSNTLDSALEVSRMYLFSPIPLLLSNIFSHLLSFCFYGLFIAIGTKREADIFESTQDTEEED